MVLKLMCCALATILADEMFRHTLAASFDNDYGNISERRRFDKQRKKRSPPEDRPFEETKENQTETVYEEPTPDPTRERLELQQNPSAPMCGLKTHISNLLTKVVPFVYPAIQQTSHMYDDNQPLAPDKPPAYL